MVKNAHLYLKNQGPIDRYDAYVEDRYSDADDEFQQKVHPQEQETRQDGQGAHIGYLLLGEKHYVRSVL